MKKAAVIGVSVLLSMSLIGCGTTGEAGEASTAKTASTKVEKTPKVIGVGESGTLDKMVVTVHSIRFAGGDLFKPKSGNTFAIVDVSLENQSDKEVAISSLVQTAMSDDAGYKYTENIVVEGKKGSFGGTVAAGRTVRGEVGFEVPQEAKSLEFTFSDPFKKGQLIWKVK